MREEGIFFNGVYESVLEEILQIQSVLPEHILFLQPFKGQAIVGLEHNPPTVADPVRLFMSVTTDLPTVRYQAEIVGLDLWPPSWLGGDSRRQSPNLLPDQPADGRMGPSRPVDLTLRHKNEMQAGSQWSTDCPALAADLGVIRA